SFCPCGVLQPLVDPTIPRVASSPVVDDRNTIRRPCSGPPPWPSHPCGPSSCWLPLHQNLSILLACASCFAALPPPKSCHGPRMASTAFCRRLPCSAPRVLVLCSR